jgi:transposase-like protein
MLIERTQHLGVGYYERNNNRLDYANGYKPKQVKTRISELDLLVPQMMKLFLVTMSGLMQSMVIGLTIKNTANNIRSGVAN